MYKAAKITCHGVAENFDKDHHLHSTGPKNIFFNWRKS